VVLMSALAPDALAERARTARGTGANVVACLTKPFWVEPLISALEQAIPDPAATGNPATVSDLAAIG